MKLTRRLGTAGGALLVLALAACSGGGGGGGGDNNNGGGGGGGGGSVTRTLSVTPNQASVEAEQSLTFVPAVTNVTTPAYTYTVVPPASLQALNLSADELARRFAAVSAAGELTVGADAEEGLVGALVVRETSAGLELQVPLLVVRPIQRVEITPGEASVLAGESTTFTASAIDFFNDPVPNVLVDWRLVGTTGSVTRTGVFTGRSAGTATLEARVGLAPVATATVVTVGSVVGLSITPTGNPVQVEAGTQRQFRAFVRDISGNTTAATATWEVIPTALGTVTAGGLFTAGVAGGEGTIRATSQGQTASLPVRIVALLTPPAEVPGNVFGIVRLPTGGPVAGALVRAMVGETEAARTTTGSDGRYRLFLPVGTYTITATAAGATGQRAGVAVLSQDLRTQVDLTLQTG
ncbi:MAG: carboxypeptidase regulatory-like domain-containing protein [Fimbriimonadaceae bacterium]|nr:carboxypeptidase regulatory-like domain-containing protein [Fimbriimonadaceae bacterium]